MSLSNARKWAGLLGLGGILLVAGCQVRPLHSGGPQGKPAQALASIQISDADDRVEQDVRNALVFLTSGGAGEPRAPVYHLALNVTSTTTGVLYDQESDTAGAGRVVVGADYNLTRTATGETVRSGN